MLCIHLDVLHADEVVLIKKNDFLCGQCKNDKILYQNKPFRDTFLNIFYTTHKNARFQRKCA
jgi:hypothetical protein